MSSIINLYDQLGPNAGPGGTWTNTTNPGTAPVAPSPYNADIDFNGFPDGTYVYRYEVNNVNPTCSSTSDVTIEWADVGAPNGDKCLGAIGISRFPDMQTNIDGNTNDSNCPLAAAPIMSEVKLPNSWLNVNSGDIWYALTVNPTAGGADPVFLATLTGVPYQSSGVYGPAIAVYNGDCGSLVLDTDSQSSTISQSVTVTIDPLLTGSSDILYIRVASYAVGQFRLTFSANF